MKYDFGGWATRNDLQCSDGRVIMKNAFKGQDGTEVPLVWNHNHASPENILGLAHLENRDEGVYAYCLFNETESGKTAKELVAHGDVRSLSIFANQLKQAGSNVVHGLIREVSLVLAGANPGAFIDDVVAHNDADGEGLIVGYDENIMLYHADTEEKPEEKKEPEKEEVKEDTDKKDESEETLQDIIDTMTEKQQNVVYDIIGAAASAINAIESKDDTNKKGEDNTMKHNVFDTDTSVMKKMYFLILHSLRF